MTATPPSTQVVTFKAYPSAFSSNATGEIKLTLMLAPDQLDKVTSIMHYRDEVLTFITKRADPTTGLVDMVNELQQAANELGGNPTPEPPRELEWDE